METPSVNGGSRRQKQRNRSRTEEIVSVEEGQGLSPRRHRPVLVDGAVKERAARIARGPRVLALPLSPTIAALSPRTCRG